MTAALDTTTAAAADTPADKLATLDAYTARLEQWAVDGANAYLRSPQASEPFIEEATEVLAAIDAHRRARHTAAVLAEQPTPEAWPW